MKILIIGGGGREHALAWKCAVSKGVQRVYVAPGNAGTSAEPQLRNIALAADDIDGLLAFAERERIGLTIVGPEAPLVAGIVDRFQRAGLRCFGPRAAAARLEGSKTYAKDFLTRHGIPTAGYRRFSRENFDRRYVESHALPIVVKADGLAAGKGVVVAGSAGEALGVIEAMFAGRFGAAGKTIVVEDYLEGEEASFTVMVDGLNVLPLASSQDHKARDDGDRGPNTGGMGAYSPAAIVSEALHGRILREIIEQTVQGLAADGTPYTGFLYAGLMIGPDGQPRVLEYNCRFGDPEAQPILMRLRSDLPALCETALGGGLDKAAADWDPRPALGVVMASGGYPDGYRRGEPISGLESIDDPDLKVFHAGTKRLDGRILTDGGRVLTVTALGRSVVEAQRRAYSAVGRIHWRDAYYRSDIGYRAIAREPGRP